MNRNNEAEKAYDGNRHMIGNRLTDIAVLLSEHRESANAAGIDYGHVGDLNYVLAQLDIVVQFLRNEDD